MKSKNKFSEYRIEQKIIYWTFSLAILLFGSWLVKLLIKGLFF